jgi:hypothetical protein
MIKDYRMDIDKYYDLKDEIVNNKDIYDEVLYPFMLASLELNRYNVERYILDYEKLSKTRYDKLYTTLKKEFDGEQIDLDKVDEEECEERTVRGYEAELNTIENTDDVPVDSSFEDFFTAEFGNLINAEDPMLDNINESTSVNLDDLMKLLDINDKLVEEDKKKEQEEKEKADKDYKVYQVEKEMKEAYQELEDALTTIIELRYKEYGCLQDEEDYVQGDVYRTYLNGDYIDLEYSPRVNASNILGGWKANEFAFPLYRHLLNKFDYDMEKIEVEFQALYRIEEEIEVPEDLYENISNRKYVVEQIMNRFEDSMKPPRYTIIMNLGDLLMNYHKALDKYYEVTQHRIDVDIDNPEYYLKAAEDSEYLTKLLREAKRELKDELLEQGYSLEGLLDMYKIVYYYDLESMMNNVELNIMNIIQNTDFRNVINIKDHISNEYYKRYDEILSDSLFDIFKYGGSMEKEEGCVSHPRIVKPRIKAKLVDKDSNEDCYKPEIFNRETYKILNIEQKIDVVINIDNQTKISEFMRKLRARDIFYVEKTVKKYNVSRSRDNMRYGLTEKEIELIEEFENMLGTVDIRDIDNIFKKTIAKIIIDEHKVCEETKEFMNDLAEFGLSEAYANRLMKINIYEINGYMNRLDYLTHVE